MRNIYRYLIISLVYFTATSPIIGQSIPDEVKKVANQFLLSNSKYYSQLATIADFDIIKEDGVVYAYAAQIKPVGFVLIAAAKNEYPILGFSYENNFKVDKTAENIILQILIEDIKNKRALLHENDILKDYELKNQNAWNIYLSNNGRKLKTSSQFGPLLTDSWGGVNCYDQDSNTIYVGNYYTPNHYSPGCVATSLSQILHFYQWPKNGLGYHTNYDNSGSSQGSYSADFANTFYDWNNMLDLYKYQESSELQQKSMGLLAFHCGTAVDMDYESYGSTSHIRNSPDALKNYFRYCGHYETVTWSYFWDRLQENISGGFPVQIGIKASNGAGHAAVCDGFMIDDMNQHFYHLNLGWWGSSNGWYLLEDAFSAGGYTSVTDAVFDILPNPQFNPILNSETEGNFTLSWSTAQNFMWESFSLEQSYNNGTWEVINNQISDTIYHITNALPGEYSFRVRAKINGSFYYNSYSEIINHVVKSDIVALDFDGDDSFFINDNSNNDLDISNSWTIETWIKIDNHISGTYPVIIDRRTSYSLYLIDDAEGDFAIRFVARNSSGDIIASLRSDYSNQFLMYNEWAHVAISHGNNQTKLFINGVEVETSNDLDFNLKASNYALNVGARYWGVYERYLNGKIDGLCLYETQKYTTNFVPSKFTDIYTSSDMKLFLKMDEGAGNLLIDSTGNFNSVSLRSSPYDPSWVFELELKQRNITIQNKVSENNKSYKFYPNPARDIIYFEFSDESEVFNIRIFELSGKCILDENISGRLNQINISDLKAGIYTLDIYNKNGSFNEKIVIY